MEIKRKIAFIILAGLLASLLGSFAFLRGMENPLPMVVLNKASICGKCGQDFEVNQNGAQLDVCGCIIHDSCVPQVYRTEKSCDICETPTNYSYKKNFKFVSRGFTDSFIDRSELSLDLDPIILARNLAKTNRNRLKEIDNKIKKYNVLMDAYNKRSEDLHNQIIQSDVLRNYLVTSATISAGLLGMFVADKLFADSKFKNFIPAGLGAASYFFGSAWIDKARQKAFSNLSETNDALDSKLKAFKTITATNK